MHLELRSVDELTAHVAHHGDLRGVVVHGLDLREVDGVLSTVSSAGAVYLGCALLPGGRQHIDGTGGATFPDLPYLPYRPYRPHLYTIDELMAGYRSGDDSSRADTADGRIWQWYRTRRDERGARVPLVEAVAQRLHDHAMDNALAELLEDDPAEPGQRRRVVAIMGGHAMARTEAAYREIVQLGRLLARTGMLVTTGGGPGAMEAAHLGAWLRDEPDAAIGAALSLLARSPTFRDPGWVDTADRVRQHFPSGRAVDSLAMPTWFYGHEPTNLFTAQIAKYFSNSLREDGLLAVATSGVVYAPGSAGTIQEIFMDAAQNHYGTFRLVSPMVFLGRRYWDEERPVRTLLERLARGRQYADRIAFVDTPQQAVDFIVAHPPVEYD